MLGALNPGVLVLAVPLVVPPAAAAVAPRLLL
jgi:hypothetical protein